MPQQPSSSDVIRQLRLPLIILVTYAHSYGQITEGYSLLSSGWDAYEVLKLTVSQTLVKVAVPAFFVMSGYLFFANMETFDVRTYRQKIQRRATTLLLPYLLWNLLMALKLKTLSLNTFWTFWTAAGMQTDWLGQAQLMTAPANMPLWFLRDLMVVCLLSPVIYIGIRRLGYWLTGLLTLWYLSGVAAFIPGLSAYAVCFFTLGACLKIRRLDLVGTCLRLERWAWPLSLVLAVAMILTYGQPVFSSLMLCFRLVSVPVVFSLAYRLTAWCRRQGLKPLVSTRLLASSSYFVYLAHYVFFLSFIDAAFFAMCGTSPFSRCTHYLLCPLLKASVLIAVYWIYTRIRQILLIRFGGVGKIS